MKKVIRNIDDYKKAMSYIGEKYSENNVWIIEFKKAPKKRKLKQSALFHMWIQLWCKSQGEAGNKEYFESVKFEIKKMFLPDIEVSYMGKIVTMPKPTSSLDTIEFNQFLENVNRYFGQEQGFSLPWPEDRFFEKVYQAIRV